jgi:hypothetical protein
MKAIAPARLEGVRAVGALNLWDTTAHVPPGLEKF